MTADRPFTPSHADLTPADVEVVLRAARLIVDASLAPDVAHLNALLSALDLEDAEDLRWVEPFLRVALQGQR